MRSKTARLSPLRPRTTSHPAALYALHLLCHVFSEASINKSTHVGQPVFSVLFALLSLAGDSPPASKRTKIPRKSKAVRCEAVLPEQKCSQTRKRPQRILCVFSRALTQYEGISARQNRVCPCQSTQLNLFYPARRGFCRVRGQYRRGERADAARHGRNGANDAASASARATSPQSFCVSSL